MSEHEPAGEEVADPVDDRWSRRYPSTIGGAFYLVILTMVAVAGGVVVSGEWRLGVRLLAVALLAAALLRLLLPSRSAGMLEVRNRFVDVLLLVVTGVAIYVLATTIPNQPPL